MAVTRQPGQYPPSEFQTGLMDCCDDCGTCVYGCFCHLCLGCSIASDMNECFMCGHGMPMRAVYRTRYNINGSLCQDFMVTWCCSFCASCQLKRDIDRREAAGHFLTG